MTIHFTSSKAGVTIERCSFTDSGPSPSYVWIPVLLMKRNHFMWNVDHFAYHLAERSNGLP